jgi:hypothetical protein
MLLRVLRQKLVNILEESSVYTFRNKEEARKASSTARFAAYLEVRFAEPPTNSCDFTQRNVPEDATLQCHRRKGTYNHITSKLRNFLTEKQSIKILLTVVIL